MAKLRLNMSVSLDGFAAGPGQSVENPLGVGGTALHEWAFATRSFRATHGLEGGQTGIDDDRAAALNENVGASIMGRNMFGPDRGPWADDPWRGWWGDDPPYHTPVFVLTHHPREPLVLRGGTTFHFVTDGIEAALQRAFEAAGGRDVSLAGGAQAAHQYLRAGLVDELEVHVAPVLLGAGARLFEALEGIEARYEPAGLVASPAASHFRFVRRNGA
jgi:dihydrofolate reductase